MASIEQRDLDPAVNTRTEAGTGSDELERQAEREREELSGTLDQLRDRLTPGQMLDSVLEYGRGDPALMMDNLKRQVVRNPLALGMVGAGLTWLMTASGSSPRAAYRTPPAGYGTGPYRPRYGGAGQAGVGSPADRAQTAGRENANGLGASARQGASRVSDGAAAATGTLARSMDAAGDAATDTLHQARDSASDLADRASEASAAVGHSLSESMDGLSEMLGSLGEHPLVLAGLGLAAGALLGAAFPITQAEEQMMGEEADSLKRQAGEVVQDQVDAVRQKARETVDAAKSYARDKMQDATKAAEDAARQGREKAQEASQQGRKAAQQLADDARQAAERSSGGGAKAAGADAPERAAPGGGPIPPAKP